MITLIHSKQNTTSSEIVYKALIRSFTLSQVNRIDAESFAIPKTPGIFVFINSIDISIEQFPKKSKIILFGEIDETIAKELGIELLSETSDFDGSETLEFSPVSSFNFPIVTRPLIRFDFPNEWNNLGYGEIKRDGSIWAVSQSAKSKKPVATIDKQYTYIELKDDENKSCVWINREVGLVDSVNWQFLEYYISAYRFNELYSLPYLLDIPANVECAVTMRLDCDEDILSAKPLFDAYSEKAVPFSLAVKTSLPIKQAEIDFLKQVQQQGSVLSHSVNHKVSWGKNYDDALHEAKESKNTLENKLSNTKIEFAVSPFHSNKDYSVKALKDANYTGFIGGLIAYDPEYLLSRGGVVPFCDDIVSHSQQCMLHGDCLLDEADPIRVYKEAFDLAVKSKTFFGYLDHPFSPRYQYGWKTEAERIQVHLDFINYIRSTVNATFLNEADCLSFMIDKSNAEIHYNQSGSPFVTVLSNKKSPFQLAVSINNEVYCS